MTCSWLKHLDMLGFFLVHGYISLYWILIMDIWTRFISHSACWSGISVRGYRCRFMRVVSIYKCEVCFSCYYGPVIYYLLGLISLLFHMRHLWCVEYISAVWVYSRVDFLGYRASQPVFSVYSLVAMIISCSGFDLVVNTWCRSGWTVLVLGRGTIVFPN